MRLQGVRQVLSPGVRHGWLLGIPYGFVTGCAAWCTAPRNTLSGTVTWRAGGKDRKCARDPTSTTIAGPAGDTATASSTTCWPCNVAPSESHVTSQTAQRSAKRNPRDVTDSAT